MQIFIAGPRAISKLNSEVLKRIDNIISSNYTILVGDANGVDKAVQNYCNDKGYRKINVFATNGNARNNIGNWNVIEVKVDHNIKGFDYYAAKDIAMSKEADYGFMIWNGKSKGTLNNIINLLLLDKKVLVYFTPEKKFHTLNSINELKILINKTDDKTTYDFYTRKLKDHAQLILPL